MRLSDSHVSRSELAQREVVTIFEIDATDDGCSATPFYSFRWTPQTDPFGVPIDRASIREQDGFLDGVNIPVRPHFGVVAVAPREAGMVDSVPPAYFGGAIDNWRAGKGSKLILPVSVAGGALSIGVPRASQGDGEAAANVIDGKDGNDVLHGYGGNDTLDTTPDTSTNRDTIADFSVGHDMIQLSHAIYAALQIGNLSASAFTIGAAATDANQHVIYNAGTGALFYDADDKSAGAAVQFAKLSTGLDTLNASSFQVVA